MTAFRPFPPRVLAALRAKGLRVQRGQLPAGGACVLLVTLAPKERAP